ncbi:MAG: ABC transporter ATP-binding protein [Actinobacteria bacterium]|nr:ABC transporter ATP-binding protein [Actinomycetota bacterium]
MIAAEERVQASVGSLLSVRDLSVEYPSQAGPVPAVRGVTFDVAEGEILGLAGESGCGKSTIAHALLRLLPPDARVTGQVLLNGEDVLTMKFGRLRAVRWDEASIVFQGAMHSMNPVQRVGDQIVEAVRLHRPGTNDRQGQAQVGELLERVGLPARRARDYPHELSGGQRQRAMIAMALACDPKLLIADEPTTALDVMVQAQVLSLLKELQRELKLGLIFITHDLSVLVELCDRIAVMYAGRIVEEGPAEAIFERPAHPYSWGLSGSFPRIGDPEYRRAPGGLPGDPPDPQRLPTGCPFHPRCPRAFEPCPDTDPPMYPAVHGGFAACLLLDSKLNPEGARA